VKLLLVSALATACADADDANTDSSSVVPGGGPSATDSAVQPGSNPGDPGWGALNESAPPNENNPSLPVPFALGFLKTDPQSWSLRMADVADDSVTTAYVGGLPKAMANEGAIVIGVGGDNSNNSWGTFFEGAVMSGFPSDEAEEAVVQNIKTVGYGQ
jgi:hypothetical protein